MTKEVEQNLKTARLFIIEFLGKANLDVADEVLHEDVQAITGLKPDGPIDGREQYKQIITAFVDAFPAVEEPKILDIFGTDDRVVVRFNSPQRHSKEFFGVPATDRIINFHETHVMKISNSRITENYVSATNLEFEMLMAPVLTPLILK